MKITELINALEEIRDEHDGDVKVLVGVNYLDSFRYGKEDKTCIEGHEYVDATRKDLSFRGGKLVLKSRAIRVWME